MWKIKQKSGTYWRDEYPDADGKMKTISVKVKDGSKEANRIAQQELQEKIEKAKMTPLRRRYSHVAKLYNEEQSMTLRKSTCRRNSVTLRTIQGILGDVYLDDLTAGYIREKMIATGKGTGTINQYIKRLKGFLRWAYQNDYLASPACYEKLAYLKDTPHKLKIADKYLESDELSALLEAMEIPRWRYLTSFLALSGLRIGEAIALDKADIDQGFIHVTKTARINFENEIGDAKTLSSVREVFIQPELADCLHKIDRAMQEQQKAFGYEYVPYLFVGADGSRIKYAAYKKYLGEKSYAVLGRKITPHALRHTHTSLLAEQGVSLDAISRRLGHEDSTLTREIYFHVTKRLTMKDAAEIAPIRLLSSPNSSPDARNPRKIRQVN